MKKRTARQRFKAARRRAAKWIRRATVQEVCPICGADARDCHCPALDLTLATD